MYGNHAIPPHTLLAVILCKATKGSNWRRQLRLRFIEHMLDLEKHSLKSSRDVSEDDIISILDDIIPQWRVGETTGEQMAAINAVCLYLGQQSEDYHIRTFSVPE